jgi:two-component system response regulator YesN
VCLINTDDPTLSAVKKQLNKLKIDISNLKDIFQNVRVVIGIGKVIDQLTDLYQNMQQAEIAVMNRFAKTGEYIIGYQDDFISDRAASVIIDSNVRNRIISSFEVLDIDSIIQEISGIQKNLEDYANDCQLIYNCYNEIINIFLFGVKNYMNQFDFPEHGWYQKQFKSFLTIEDIFEWLKKQLRDEFEKYINNKKIQDSKPIRQAKQYINDNYNKEINLESVSNLIGFNPAYFSALFKKETGENFMEYVMKIRIQNAKLLLIQTSKDVADIAADVGYTDLKYFSKLFKKKTGLNPSEFRKLYS